MAAILAQLPNILLGLDALDSIAARFQKISTGMKAAVNENRDLTADELATFRQDSEDSDVKLKAAIDAARQREAALAASTAAGAQAGIKPAGS